MRFKTIIYFFLLSEFAFSAQVPDTISVDRIEKILQYHDEEAIDSVLQHSELDFGKYKSTYYEDCVVGMVFYKLRQYGNAVATLNVALNKMDSLHLCSNVKYLETAYYLADSYVKLGMLKECEAIIKYSLFKSVNKYNTNIYAKKMFQILLTIYKELGHPNGVIEQVHNEIQKISVSIYTLNNGCNRNDAYNDFIHFNNYLIDRYPLKKQDSLYMNSGKAPILYRIGDYDEAIWLYEKIIKEQGTDDYNLLYNEDDTFRMYLMLLEMYARKADVQKVEETLSVLFKEAYTRNGKYDEYLGYVEAGYYMFKANHNVLAQSYFERCDSFLNANKKLPEWRTKKENVLSKMIFNCREIEAFKKILKYCGELKKFADLSIYNDYYFLYFNQSLAYTEIAEYNKAIHSLKNLEKNIRRNKKEMSTDYLMTNLLLGKCYVQTNKNEESIKHTILAIKIYEGLKLNQKGLYGSLLNNYGKALLQKKDYKKALFYLNSAVKVQIEQSGLASPKTLNYIIECRKQLK